jgi:hypothetical protein
MSSQMVPEGTTEQRRRVSSWWLVLAVVFVGYLVFRLVQGAVWLVHHL